MRTFAATLASPLLVANMDLRYTTLQEFMFGVLADDLDAIALQRRADNVDVPGK